MLERVMGPMTWVPAADVSPAPSLPPLPGANLPILDGLLVIVLLVALYVGYRGGVMRPIFTQLFFLGAILTIYRDRNNFFAATGHFLHANVVVSVFLALAVAVLAGYAGSLVGTALHRMPITRGVDGFLGVFANLLIATAVLYVLLSGLLTFERAFQPIRGAAQLTADQVATLTRVLDSNSVAAALVDPQDLAKLREEAAQGQQAQLSSVAQLNNLDDVYLRFVRPQLRSSRLAPWIMRVGQRIPVIGRMGPSDLPR